MKSINEGSFVNNCTDINNLTSIKKLNYKGFLHF